MATVGISDPEGPIPRGPSREGDHGIGIARRFGGRLDGFLLKSDGLEFRGRGLFSSRDDDKKKERQGE